MSKTIQQTVEFNATPAQVYELIMDEKQHLGFTSSGAKISREVGGSFSVWGGYAAGKNLELVPNTKIVQSWRASDWPEGVESEVIFEFKPKTHKTELHFTQTGVPDEFYDDISQGWQDNYWSLMKEYLQS